MTRLGIHPRRLVMYDVPLTLTPEPLIVRVTLPRDLTRTEAERLCGIIHTLVLPKET